MPGMNFTRRRDIGETVPIIFAFHGASARCDNVLSTDVEAFYLETPMTIDSIGAHRRSREKCDNGNTHNYGGKAKHGRISLMIIKFATEA